MYSKITTDRPAQCSAIRINADSITKIYRILLLFQSNDLNFNEKSGNSATSKYENITVAANIKKRLSVSVAHEYPPDEIKHNEHINNALAGVGNPINESVCRESMLNFANRNAENTAIINADTATHHPQVKASTGNPYFSAASDSKTYMMEAGATPKLTTSANESSSFPIAEYAFNQQAANPSKKSKTAAARMKYAAISNMLLNDMTTDKQPQNRFKHVNKFGTWRIGDFLSDFITKCCSLIFRQK